MTDDCRQFPLSGHVLVDGCSRGGRIAAWSWAL